MESNYSDDRPFIELRLLFQGITEEIRFLKNQQWKVTNYGLLLYGALFGISIQHYLKGKPCFQVISLILVITIFGAIDFILNKLQKDIDGRREQLKRIFPKFTKEFNEARGAKKDEREKVVYFLLRITLILGAILALGLICFFNV